MATFKADQVNHYGGSGGSGFFSISQNHESKRVRIMYDGIEDVEGMSVHKVKVNDKDRYVNCPRNYDDPEDACPFCADKIPVQARLFIPIYNIDEDQVQIWDRGKTMFQKIAGLVNRYSQEKPFVSTIFDIERNGEPKDKQTDYSFYPIETDDTSFEDLPEPPTILGGLVLDKTVDEMEYYLKHKEFPDDGDSSEEEEEPPRRRGSEDSSRRQSSTTSRRTPNRGRERF